MYGMVQDTTKSLMCMTTRHTVNMLVALHQKLTPKGEYVKWPGICPHQTILGHSYHMFMDKEKLEDRQN